MNTAILLCYGYLEPENREYKDYVDWVVKDMTENDLEKLIICGGQTNPAKGEQTEAGSVKQYLRDTHPQLVNIELEDRSITTNKNLEFVAGKITDEDKLIVYCDLTRVAKVTWLALTYLLRKDRHDTATILLEYVKGKKPIPFVYENLTVKGFVFPSRDINYAIAQSFSSLLEVEAIYDKTLEDKILEIRRQDFGH